MARGVEEIINKNKGDVKKVLLMLSSSYCSLAGVEKTQMMARHLFSSKRIPMMELDGANPEKRSDRELLFACSGLRGKYPQFFWLFPDGRIEFIGLWELIEKWNEACEIPTDFLTNHPEIDTFETIFSDIRDDTF